MPDRPPPPIGVTPPETARKLTGLELLRGIRDGQYPTPPMFAVLDLRFAELEPGLAVLEGAPDERFYNTLGTVHGGYAATLLDACTSSAVQTLLPAGQSYATVEFKVNLVRPLSADVGAIRGEGRIVHAGRTVATAAGRLVDAAGKLYAHGTCTCLLFPA